MALIKGTAGAIHFGTMGAASTAFTKTAMTANAGKTVFSCDDEAARFWDPAVPVTVYYNNIATATYQSVQYPGGIVTWASTPGNDAVTVSGAYLAVAAMGEVKGFTIDTAWEFVDVTVMGDAMRNNLPTFRGTTVTIDKFYEDSTYFTEMTTATRLVCGFDLFVNRDAGTPANNIRYTGLGVIASESISTPVEGVIEGPITINVTDGVYYVAGLA